MPSRVLRIYPVAQVLDGIVHVDFDINARFAAHPPLGMVSLVKYLALFSLDNLLSLYLHNAILNVVIS